MKSLLDIQQDIRKIEKSIQVISKDIIAINDDIDDLRKASVVDMFDFDIIDMLSDTINFKMHHPLKRLDDGVQCKIYIEMLLNIVRLDVDQETAINRMVFLQWIQKEAWIDMSLEELYKDTFKQGKKAFYDLARELPPKYRDCFMLDALIVSNIAGMSNGEIQEYIVDLAAVLGMGCEKMRALAFVARTILCQDICGFSRDQKAIVLEYASQFKYYLTSEIIGQAKSDFRILVMNETDSDVRDFKWRVDNNEKVEKKEVIATFKKRSEEIAWPPRYKDVEKKASQGGVVYHYKNNHHYYAVIAHETDDMEAIKAWVKENGY